jgi:pyruvate/2-oxoglutarate dehydrogenase complex dihydrolipoamide dehydrogenase (E3) component
VGDIGLNTVGLPAHGPIKVDSSMRATGVADGWLYAVGDVNGRNLLPQVCVVRRTESHARADGFTVRVVEYDTAAIHGAYLQAVGYTGRAKMVVDEDSRVLLTVTFVGPATVDLLHSATIAVNAEVPLDRLWHAVPSFPTVSEIWLRLLEEYGL